MARPTKFNPTIQLIARMAALYGSGRTDKEVAYLIGIAPSTLHAWKKAHPEFSESIKEAKEIPDTMVEHSLFQRATGYVAPHEEIFCAFGKVTRVKTLKHYPPDPTSIIYWLSNRRPDKWRRNPHSAEPEDTDKQASASNEVQKIEIKSFKQFCTDSGYPCPFPRQIDMMKFGLYETDIRMILGARGYGKTDYVTILGVAYLVYCDYMKKEFKETNLIISKSKTRNTSMIEEIAQALSKNGVELEKENASCIRVKGLKGKDHSVEVLTIKSSFRGRHPKRILMDDPVTEEDTSEATRKLVKKKYDEAYKLCKNICIIGQPAHAFDLYSELKDLVKLLEIPWGQIPELDADLEAMKLAGVDEHSIEMSYHLRIPQDGASIFANLKYIDKFPNGDCVAIIDPSEGGDFTALTIIKAYMDGVAVYGKVWKKAWYHCLEEIGPVLKSRGVKKLAFETNSTGKNPLVQLRQAFPGIGIVDLYTTTNKHSDIVAAGSYSHLIHLSKESDKAYTNQVVQYEVNSKNDDAPDSLARGLIWLGLLRGRK